MRALLPVLLALALVAPTADERWTRGTDYYNRASFDAALREWRALVREFPASDLRAPALFRIGELLRDRGDEAGYVRSLWSAIRCGESPTADQARLALARFLAGRSLSGYAARAYAAIVGGPSDLGREEALAYLKTAGEPEEPLAVDGAADGPSLRDLAPADLDRIGRLLAEAAKRDAPYAAGDAALHGEILDALESDRTAARRRMKRFLDLYPRSPLAPEVRFLTALEEERDGNLGTALNLLRVARASAGAENLRGAIDRRLGFILKRLGRDGEALAPLEAAGERLAGVLIRHGLGDDAGAADRLERLLAEAGLGVPRTLADVRRAVPDLLPAVACVDLDGLESPDRSTRACLKFAIAKLEAGADDSAEVLFRTVLRRESGHEGAQLGLALARLLQGERRSARDALERLLADRDDPRLLGLAYAEASLSGRAADRARLLLALAGHAGPAFGDELERLRKEGFAW